MIASDAALEGSDPFSQSVTAHQLMELFIGLRAPHQVTAHDCLAHQQVAVATQQDAIFTDRQEPQACRRYSHSGRDNPIPACASVSSAGRGDRRSQNGVAPEIPGLVQLQRLVSGRRPDWIVQSNQPNIRADLADFRVRNADGFNEMFYGLRPVERVVELAAGFIARQQRAQVRGEPKSGDLHPRTV